MKSKKQKKIRIGGIYLNFMCLSSEIVEDRKQQKSLFKEIWIEKKKTPVI